MSSDTQKVNPCPNKEAGLYGLYYINVFGLTNQTRKFQAESGDNVTIHCLVGSLEMAEMARDAYLNGRTPEEREIQSCLIVGPLVAPLDQ